MQWPSNLPSVAGGSGGARDLNGLSDLEKQLTTPSLIRSLDVTQPDHVGSFAQEVKECWAYQTSGEQCRTNQSKRSSPKYLRPSSRRFSSQSWRYTQYDSLICSYDGRKVVGLS